MTAPSAEPPTVAPESTLDALDPDHEDTSLPALVSRRLSGHNRIDEWGYDPDLVVALGPLVALRWSVEVAHAERVPEVGGAVLVHNRRFGVAESVVSSTAIGRAVGRPVRFAGVTDRDPFGPLLRRVGGVPRHRDDLRVLLRAGEVLAVPLRGRSCPSLPFRSGPTDSAPRTPMAFALELGLPVIPVAIQGFELARVRRIAVGEPIVTRRRRTVVSTEELALLVGARVRELLDRRGQP